MEERLGRFGWYLACTLYPEHAERRSLSKVIGDDSPSGDVPTLEGAGLPCPQCGAEHGGKLAQRRSRFGYFLGCDRYPECRFIPKPEVPEEFRLSFDAACPACGDEHQGKLRPRRNTKRNTYFYSCDRYPECRFIPKPEVPVEFRLDFDAMCPICGPEHGGKLGPKKNNKRGTYFYSCNRYPDCKTIRPRPTGATHAACGAVIGRDDEGGICTKCGARVELPEVVLPGTVIAGGEPDPLAWAPKRPRRGAAADGGAKAAPKSTAKAKPKARAKRTAKAAAKEKDPAEIGRAHV